MAGESPYFDANVVTQRRMSPIRLCSSENSVVVDK